MSSRLFKSPAENVLKEFPSNLIQVNPKHNLWEKRVLVEAHNIKEYLAYLDSKIDQMWFFLKPSRDKQYNYKRWDGNIKVPYRPDIEFEIRVILPTGYPLISPTCFAEKKIMEYCAGHIYPYNIWKDIEGPDASPKEFVMICHDHMKEQVAWDPHLSIAHFLIREVQIWWMSKINTVLNEWNSKNG